MKFVLESLTVPPTSLEGLSRWVLAQSRMCMLTTWNLLHCSKLLEAVITLGK
jgi:hypothetical protein